MSKQTELVADEPKLMLDVTQISCEEARRQVAHTIRRCASWLGIDGTERLAGLAGVRPEVVRYLEHPRLDVPAPSQEEVNQVLKQLHLESYLTSQWGLEYFNALITKILAEAPVPADVLNARVHEPLTHAERRLPTYR